MENEAQRRGILTGISSVLDGSVPLLFPDVQVFEAMLDGWRSLQMSGNRAVATVEANERAVRRFQAFTNEYPWHWKMADIEEFTTELRSSPKPASLTTIRAYQGSIRRFLDYVTHPGYDWGAVCERQFGTHPIQICSEWNTAVHVSEDDGRPARRALTKQELQRVFDYADDQVALARKNGRKGWLSAFRDATAFKVAYAWGLRRREVTMLDRADWGTNPRAPEFGEYGTLNVRWGKATKGSNPRRRTVLTVFPWSTEVVREWVGDYREFFDADHDGMWPSERNGRIGMMPLGARWAQYRSAVGLPDVLGLHCLRHSYVTHLIESGFDALFVQQQVGHSYASTTAVYTSVSSEYRNRVLGEALRNQIDGALKDGSS